MESTSPHFTNPARKVTASRRFGQDLRRRIGTTASRETITARKGLMETRDPMYVSAL